MTTNFVSHSYSTDSTTTATEETKTGFYEEDATPPSSGSFVAWPEILGFHGVRKGYKKGQAFLGFSDGFSIVYKPKIKLHGSNGGVAIWQDEEGNYYVDAQSRHRTLSVKDGIDNSGFARWVGLHTDAFVDVRKAVKKLFPATNKTVVFGEWCGPGVQSGVALANIKNKVFAVFAVLVDDGIICEPDDIQSFFPQKLPEGLFILPWMNQGATSLNFSDAEHLQVEIAKLNTLVESVDAMDPWVKDIFQVEGPGEGLVWYPVSLQNDKKLTTLEHFGQLAFKGKGEAHAVAKQDKPVQIEPQVASSISEFVSNFVTEGRCKQGLTTVAAGEQPSKALVGKFVKWMVGDVQKESVAELEASKLTWNQLEKHVSTAARLWLLEYLEKGNTKNK